MARVKFIEDSLAVARRGALNTPGPSTARATRGKERVGSHHRPLPNREELALKKARRAKIQALRNRSHVYVGNLAPSVTEEALENVFQSCGENAGVTVSIRRTSHFIDEDIPGESGTGDRYATVEFGHPQGSRAAVQKSGTEMDGCKITVCLTATDLPEVRRIRERHRQLRENGGNIFKTGIPLQPTLILNSPDSDPARRSNTENLPFGFGPVVGYNPALVDSSNKTRYHRVKS